MTIAKADAIPRGAWPRGLTEPQAAAYVGQGSATFSRDVDAGIWPGAAWHNGRIPLWDRHALDRAFDARAQGRASCSADDLDREFDDGGPRPPAPLRGVAPA